MASRPLRRTLVIGCLAAIAFWSPQAAWAQDRQLFMLVTDFSDRPILDVRADEVDLQMVGAECTIKDMHLDAAPMKVALLVDNSDAAAQSLNPLRDGLSAFLDALPPEHEVGLFTIAGQVRRRVDFTTDRDELKERASGLFVDRNTGVIYIDGLVETWERRFDDDDPWPVFVALVYDGAEGSRSTQQDEFNEFANELVMRAATVHAVLVSTRGGNVQTEVSTFLTRNTGGTYRALAAPTALADVFTELGELMGEHHRAVQDRYRVVYECEPGDAGGSISAGVLRPNVLVRLYPNRRLQR